LAIMKWKTQTMNNMDPFLSMDELLGVNPKNKNSFTNKPLVMQHNLYLTGEIQSADNYTDWFELIRNANKTDIIRIHINSYGGDLFTAIQLMRCMAESQGNIIASVEGACMSAATMVFLHADTFEVSDHSAFMFHNYSGISIGKGGEMYAQVSFEKKLFDKLMKKVYIDFLQEDEIDEILHGKDLWLDGEEVILRLKEMGKDTEQLELKLGDDENEEKDGDEEKA